MIQGKLSDFRTHGRLRKLRNGILGILHSVTEVRRVAWSVSIQHLKEDGPLQEYLHNNPAASYSPGFIRVKDPRVQHTIQFQGDIVGRDGILTGYLDSRLLQTLNIGNPVQEWDQDRETGF